MSGDHREEDAERTDEIPFVVARVVLQDFTGVPLLADLAAMRNVAAAFDAYLAPDAYRVGEQACFSANA